MADVPNTDSQGSDITDGCQLQFVNGFLLCCTVNCWQHPVTGCTYLPSANNAMCPCHQRCSNVGCCNLAAGV